MSTANKIRIGWVAFTFVVAHFAMIVIYAFPAQYMPESLKSVSQGYVYPVFEQSWSLFAPCPLVDGHLRVKYYFENDSTDWINPIAEAEKVHSMFRITYHADLILGESNVWFWVVGDLQDMGLSPYESFPADSTDAFKYTASYWRLLYYLKGNADYLYDEQPVRAFVECSFENVSTGEKGVMILPEFNWTE